MKMLALIAALAFSVCFFGFAKDNDTVTLAEIIGANMGKEPFVVKVAFAEMLLERMKSQSYPSSLLEVAKELSLKTSGKASESDIRAAIIAKEGMNFGGGALNAKKATPPKNFDGVALYGWIFY